VSPITELSGEIKPDGKVFIKRGRYHVPEFAAA
jgi:hypothetical protein